MPLPRPVDFRLCIPHFSASSRSFLWPLRRYLPLSDLSFSTAPGLILPGFSVLEVNYKFSKFIPGNRCHTLDAAQKVCKITHTTLYVANGCRAETPDVAMQLISVVLYPQRIRWIAKPPFTPDGAGEGARTLDILLGMVVVLQTQHLHYSLYPPFFDKLL